MLTESAGRFDLDGAGDEDEEEIVWLIWLPEILRSSSTLEEEASRAAGARRWCRFEEVEAEGGDMVLEMARACPSFTQLAR